MLVDKSIRFKVTALPSSSLYSGTVIFASKFRWTLNEGYPVNEEFK
jgi:hypothetical protein